MFLHIMAIRLIDGSEFLHIPKTGGSWITRVLEENHLVAQKVRHKHVNYDLNLFGDRMGNGRQLMGFCSRLVANKIIRTLGLSLEGPDAVPCFRFCFVRHPLSWYESWWRYMKARGWNDWGQQNSARYWDPNSMLNGLGSDDFNAFVENVIHVRPGYVSELFYSYTKPGISFIGKTENLREDTFFVLNKLGFSISSVSLNQLEKVNASKTPAEEVVWDEELRRVVMQLELPALIHFGYLNVEERMEFGIPETIVPNSALRQR